MGIAAFSQPLEDEGCSDNLFLCERVSHIVAAGRPGNCAYFVRAEELADDCQVHLIDRFSRFVDRRPEVIKGTRIELGISLVVVQHFVEQMLDVGESADCIGSGQKLRGTARVCHAFQFAGTPHDGVGHVSMSSEYHKPASCRFIGGTHGCVGDGVEGEVLRRRRSTEANRGRLL